MRPIVDGLQAEFEGQAAFAALNARDGAAGEAAFAQLGLIGHPAVVIFDAAGRERYRDYSVQPAEQVRAALTQAVAGP
jgi:hypothetical protein